MTTLEVPMWTPICRDGAVDFMPPSVAFSFEDGASLAAAMSEEHACPYEHSLLATASALKPGTEFVVEPASGMRLRVEQISVKRGAIRLRCTDIDVEGACVQLELPLQQVVGIFPDGSVCRPVRVEPSKWDL